MSPDEFKTLKKTLVTRSTHSFLINNSHWIEVAVGDNGIVHYAAEVDMNGKFIAMRPEHPFAEEIAKRGMHYT